MIAATLLTVGSTAFSPSYRDCARQQDQQTTNSERDSLRRRVGVVVFCEAVFAQENNGAITAIATILVAIFTLTLWLTSNEQARLTRESIKLASDEFIASHRPRLTIREPRLIWPSKRAPAIINFVLENCGDSNAIIVDSAIEHQLAPDPELPLFTVLRRDVVLEHGALAAGSSVRLNHNTRTLVDERDMMPNVNGDTLCHFLGRIAFEDERGVRREMAFCRRFNTKKGRFCIVPDSEDEYG